MKQTEYRVEERFAAQDEEARRAAVQARMEVLLRVPDAAPEAQT